jgi:NodT family efflux transporter outer membrane factor (OMF) lipoprotein
MRIGLSASCIAALALTLSACRVKEPPDVAALKKEAMPTVTVPLGWTTIGPTPELVIGGWIASFGDQQLTDAVNEGIANNPDLRVGAARVEEAMLAAKLAGAKLWPSVDVLARGGGKLSGDGSGLQGGVLSVNWEVDLWGRVRAGRAAAAADAASSTLDLEFARQSLAGVVARTWFLAIEAELQAETARQTVHDADELVRLAEVRSKVGVGNDEDIYVARATAGTYRDAARQIEAARTEALRALEVLIGRYPAAAIAVAARLPDLPPSVPAGLPSDLLERRPDVIAAERRVAAAFHRIQEAKAARLPVIGLTTGVSAISSDLFLLKDHENPVWNVGANLLMPIFKGGALKTQVEIRTVEQKQAVAAYAGVGLKAFAEVENALTLEIAAREREQILTQTMADNQRAFDIVRRQYDVGMIDLRLVSQRQLALNATRSSLIRMQAEQRIQRVNLHLALGGGFVLPPVQP